MANAKKLPSGNWRVNLYIGKDTNGKREYKSFTNSSKKQAEFLAAEYRIKLKEKPSNKIVQQAVQDYIDSKSNILSVSTIRGYNIIEKNAIDYIKNIKLCDITELDIQKWMNINAAKYSSKSVRNQFGLIIVVLKQNKICIDTSNILLKPKQRKNILIPSKEQITKILYIVKNTTIELPVTLALTLGLRQSEIAALHWEDYDGSIIYIHRSSVPDKNNVLIEREQNKSFAGTRILDVPDVLKERLDKSYHKSDDERISPTTPFNILKTFHRICRENGLPEFTMHCLRHANASLMLYKNVPDKYAMERLGQSTQSMLKSVYQHIFKEEQNKVASQMNDCFSELCNTENNNNSK